MLPRELKGEEHQGPSDKQCDLHQTWDEFGGWPDETIQMGGEKQRGSWMKPGSVGQVKIIRLNHRFKLFHLSPPLPMIEASNPNGFRFMWEKGPLKGNWWKGFLHWVWLISGTCRKRRWWNQTQLIKRVFFIEVLQMWISSVYSFCKGHLGKIAEQENLQQ